MNNNRSVGIFDSGVGGLTIAQSLMRSLPGENFIYFGDTAHFPYGEKSTAEIQAYSIKICNFLLEKQCKLILVACNSASAASYDLIKDYVSHRAIVMNVIDPTITFLGKHYANKAVGLIGTEKTVHSNIYQQKIGDLNRNITLKAHPAPMLASAIEQHFDDPQLIHGLLIKYLGHTDLVNIDALLLACTHYPIIKKNIIHFYRDIKKTVDIIDTSEQIAQAVQTQLAEENLLNRQTTGSRQFYISEYFSSFETIAELFFGANIQLIHYPLWD